MENRGKTYRIRTIDGPKDVLIDDLRPLTHTPQMRRLARISTLGCVSEVYPGATHNRFEHSLGVLYLAHRVGRVLNLSDSDSKLLRTYAVTHDIGHGPESHIWEYVAKSITGEDHKSVGLRRIKEKEVVDALEYAGVDIDDLISMYKRENPLSKIIYEPTGVDKLDYILRDRHECAIDGGCDMLALLANYRFDDGILSINDRAKKEVKNFLLTFLQNYHEIYLKKSVEIVKGIITKAIYHAIKSKDLDPLDGWGMDDAQLRVALLGGPSKTKKYMHLLETRDFPKAAGVLKLEGYANAERLGGKPIYVETASRDEKEMIRNLYSDGFDTKMEAIEKLEERVAKKLGLEPDQVLITLPRNFGEKIAKNVRIYREGSIDENRGPNLVRIGEIFNGLNEEMENEISRHWAVRLCVPENKREEMYRKMKEIGLREIILN